VPARAFAARASYEPVIDLHCHLLPGIDDGPDDIEGAIALARAAASAGTQTLVATPHIDHWWHVEPAMLPERAAEVRAALAAAGVEMAVAVSGEIALTRLVELTDDELAALSLGPARHLLLEAPLSPGAGHFDPVLLAMQDRGWRVLLAHPERCPAFLRRPERLERLLEAGVLVQVTAGSLAGQFGNEILKTTVRWIEAGWVHVVASDAHDAYRRPPGLLEPIERAGLAALAPWLTEAVPRSILEGTPVPERPPLPERPAPRGLFGRLRPRA
jgi:protein-tyrosine phosphatase